MVGISEKLLVSSPRPTVTTTSGFRRRSKRGEEITSTMVTKNDPTIPIGKNFTECYMELCKRHHLRPLPVICVTLPYNLDFTTDRVKMEDWRPILNSLSLDRSLRSISIRSRYQYRKPSEGGNLNLEEKTRSKGPGALTQGLLEWLSHSIGQCMRNSYSLTHLELEGIPFPTDCLAVLCVGLAGTETLEHLSFQRCYIGDAGCELVCRAITDVRTIRSLNLTDCDLTSRCGTVLAGTLSRQELSLYHETWKQSLRYRDPNIEAMPGLRRLTLNDNPQLGDSVVLKMIGAIRDSLWLKAVDLRHCGLTDQIGNDLLELLEHNTSLTVLDVRQNPNMNENLIKMILQRLEGKEHDEYGWLNSSGRDRKFSSMNLQRKKSKICNKENEINNDTYEKNKNHQIKNTIEGNVNNNRSRISIPKSITRKDNSRAMESNRVKDQFIKPSLHLDLQSRIKPIVETTKSLEVSESSVRFSTRKKYDSNSKTDIEKTNENRERIIEITRELVLARTTHERLLEESKRQDLLVAREKIKREIAETNLRVMSTDLADLENVLREKDRETDGFLLVSQRSLNDICASFDRLVELLENLTRNSKFDRKHVEENLVASKDVKRRVDSVVRKSKSENLGRGYVVDIEDDEREDETIENDNEMIVESSRFDKKKFVKSEGDVRRKQPVPLSPLRVERNIGDNPDVVGLTPKGLDLGCFDAGDKCNMSSADKAKDIFLRFVNGEVKGNFSIG